MIDVIAKIDYPNVTNIAQTMHMTRGAISKISRKLSLKHICLKPIKKHFKLTEERIKLFKEHKKGITYG